LELLVASLASTATAALVVFVASPIQLDEQEKMKEYQKTLT
jgi:hypothetical protein